MQPEGQHQGRSAPAQGRPDHVLRPSGRPQGLGQGIEQPLGQEHALAQAAAGQAAVACAQAFGPADFGHQARQLVQPANRWGWAPLAWRTSGFDHGARMGPTPAPRPVVPERPQPPQPAGWPEGSAAGAAQLHQLLTIGDRQWHAFKGQPQRRAAEQLAAALVQLLDGANPPQAPVASPQRLASIALVENALAWLKGDLRDPGCPQHGPAAPGARANG